MKMRATWLSEVNKGTIISDLLYILGLLEFFAVAFITWSVLSGYWNFISWLADIDKDNLWGMIIRFLLSGLSGFAAAGFTLGFAVLIEDVHAIRVQTAGYDVEELPETAPEVVEQPARHGKRKAQRAQPEDYDPYDVDQ